MMLQLESLLEVLPADEQRNIAQASNVIDDRSGTPRFTRKTA
jgi:hypothetical protein